MNIFLSVLSCLIAIALLYATGKNLNKFEVTRDRKDLVLSIVLLLGASFSILAGLFILNCTG
jgi:uncharacterized membrane protein